MGDGGKGAARTPGIGADVNVECIVARRDIKGVNGAIGLHVENDAAFDGAGRFGGCGAFCSGGMRKQDSDQEYQVKNGTHGAASFVWSLG